ncbi:hypothetical protein P5G65_23725 [Paenibacillus chondroitinus]|uniref:ATP-binding protein n=1 Tax=Paenibacillus chondroitinus TaxID=59842 RepID=A0ABU6DGW9_9BACL|nr:MULTISPECIES: hypothetical protein [Paenibacillus]MCY9659519.1 hypothetical protein [Paenibacillus anseongense]MEB4796914.1 hypothetical protein [Paenibacillus chondroitinus]
MQIYGLYGKSGTGKSYKCLEVVFANQIDAVIDDGILIIDRVHVAGKSAKCEKLLYSATKRAIFQSDDHCCREVADFIHMKKEITKILILGTSKRMIQKIATRLDLPTEIEWIPIETVQLKDELLLARKYREEGYHVIPIQPVQVEKTYRGWSKNIPIQLSDRIVEVILIRPFDFRASDVKPN